MHSINFAEDWFLSLITFVLSRRAHSCCFRKSLDSDQQVRSRDAIRRPTSNYTCRESDLKTGANAANRRFKRQNEGNGESCTLVVTIIPENVCLTRTRTNCLGKIIVLCSVTCLIGRRRFEVYEVHLGRFSGIKHNM